MASSSDARGGQATLQGESVAQQTGGTGAAGPAPTASAPGEMVAHVHPGDVVWFVHRRMHAHVTAPDGSVPGADEAVERPAMLRVEWLDGYGPGEAAPVSAAALDRLAGRGDLRVTHAGVMDPAERWAGAYLERHPTADVNRGETGALAPRVQAAAHTVQREWSHGLINGLLEHPIGDHRLGRRQFMRAAWTARRPDGRPSAATVLTRPNAPVQADGRTIELARYVSHPDATESRVGTNNTATWMLARVARWARLEGFDRLLSYSGVAGNDGGIYRGLPFEHVGWTDADPERWTSRDGRTAADSVDAQKKRWVWTLQTSAGPVERRAAARGDEQTGLSAFAAAPDVDARRPGNFTLCREERPDEAGTSTSAPAVSDRARALFDADGPTDAVDRVGALRRRRLGDDKPAAVFGADVDGTLVAALAVGGAPTQDGPATIGVYAARETAWPDNTARWLAARVAEWAPLAGYDEVTVADGAFASADRAPTEVLE